MAVVPNEKPTNAADCPNSEALQRFMIGETPDTDVEAMEDHIETCSYCSLRIEQLHAEDNLVQAMRTGSPILAGSPSASCERIIQVARSMHPRPLGHECVDSDTPRSDVTLSGSGEWQRYDFLDPAIQSDEIGRIGPYRVQRVVGRGGMGVVFEAVDSRLQRKVALKVILDSRYADSRYTARFQAEATALARLQHPNIVQIHEVSQHHGRPYIALEFMDGGSLAPFLAGLSQPFRVCAEVSRTLALAVQFAHQQGIIHRDLKPANVLVSTNAEQPASDVPSKVGTTNLLMHTVLKIADFGLAQQLEEPGLTQTGELLGTPGYMAPEMALRSSERGGPAVDIYALGAILYETLTGRPPFQGDSLLATLEQVRTIDPVPPHRLRASVPRDLETICLKCLEKDPGNRYETAQGLAGDLQRYLEGRPILARPAGVVERIRKGIRRRPLLAILVAISALMVLGSIWGVAYHNMQLRAQVERADMEAARALAARNRADYHYDQARQTLSRILESFNHPGTASIPAMVELHKTQSELALDFFQGVFAAQKDLDPRQRDDLAAAYKEAARLQMILGRAADAETNFKRAIGLFDEMSAESKEAPENLAVLAACYDFLGLLLAGQPNRGDEAVAYGCKAVELQEQLNERDPSNARLKFNLARSYENLGTLYRSNPGGSVLELYERSLELGREALRVQPEDVAMAVSLAQTCSNIGAVYVGHGQADKADAVYREALGILEPLSGAEPNHVNYGFSLAALRINCGFLSQSKQLWEEALQQYTLALELLQRVLQREPNFEQARAHLLPAHGGRAQSLSQLGHHKESALEWDQVVALAAPADLPDYRILRAHVLVAAGQFQKAASEVDEVAQTATGQPVYYYEAGNVHAQIATALADDPKSAEQHADQSIVWLQKAEAGGFFMEPANAEYLKSPVFSLLEQRPEFLALHRESLSHEVSKGSDQ